MQYICAWFKLQFYYHYPLKCDRFYLTYFLSILKEKITARLICGHVFWCQRRSAIHSECKFCCHVFRWENHTRTTFQSSSNYIDFWDTHAEKVFGQDNYLEQNLQ